MSDRVEVFYRSVWKHNSKIYLRICPLLPRGLHSFLSALEPWSILGVNSVKKPPSAVSHLLGIEVVNAKNLLRPQESVVRTFQTQLPVRVNFCASAK